MSGQRPYNGLMTNTETTNPAPKTYRRGDFAAVPAMGDTYQVVNTRTGKRSQPRTLLRALRILVKVTR